MCALKSKSLRWAVVSMVLAAGALAAGPAHAVPMGPDQIDQGSDLVVIVDVLAVACHSVEEWGSRHGAWVQIREVVRGPRVAGETFVIDFVQLGPQSGGVEVLLYAGQRVKLYLNSDNGKPDLWHPDARIVLVDAPAAAHVLPRKSGEVLLAAELAGNTQPREHRTHRWGR